MSRFEEIDCNGFHPISRRVWELEKVATIRSEGMDPSHFPLPTSHLHKRVPKVNRDPFNLYSPHPISRLPFIHKPIASSPALLFSQVQLAFGVCSKPKSSLPRLSSLPLSPLPSCKTLDLSAFNVAFWASNPIPDCFYLGLDR